MSELHLLLSPSQVAAMQRVREHLERQHEQAMEEQPVRLEPPVRPQVKLDFE